MSLGGGKPKAPPKPQPTATEIEQARISAEKWNDFVQRYYPVETLLRQRVSELSSPEAYAKAVAKAANNASAQLGRSSMAAAQQIAAGSSPLAMLTAYDAANDLAAKGMVQQYNKQRSNYLNQANSLLKMGANISGQGMGAFKSVADYDASEANRIYADRVGRDLANASQRLAALNSLGQLAVLAYPSWYAKAPMLVDGFGAALKYGTNPYSEQSYMLALQDRGL